jgi:rhamnosyl/mannosyltransferase
MRRLRILHLGKYYPPVRGGIETVVETMCRGDATWADAHALVVNRARTTTSEVRDGVHVRRVGSVGTFGAVTVAPTLPVWLRRTDADVLVLHEPNPMALLAYGLARPAMPLVVYFHAEVVRPWWQYRLLYEPLLRFALRRASRIVVSSPPMLNAAPLAPYQSKCAVVPLGLQAGRHDGSGTASDRARRFARRLGRPTILFVGRLVAYKGVAVLIRAMQGLEADLAILGDGPERAVLERLARTVGVADRVRFLGELPDDDLVAWYHACDLFVLPSVTRQETFGMVLLEAMACGKPVVSTELGTGTSWVNQHERTGLVVRPGDSTDLHHALARLVADPDLRVRFGSCARARVLEHFTSEIVCDTTRSLYQDLTHASAPLAPGHAASIA